MLIIVIKEHFIRNPKRKRNLVELLKMPEKVYLVSPEAKADISNMKTQMSSWKCVYVPRTRRGTIKSPLFLSEATTEWISLVSTVKCCLLNIPIDVFFNIPFPVRFCLVDKRHKSEKTRPGFSVGFLSNK